MGGQIRVREHHGFDAGGPDVIHQLGKFYDRRALGRWASLDSSETGDIGGHHQLDIETMASQARRNPCRP